MGQIVQILHNLRKQSKSPSDIGIVHWTHYSSARSSLVAGQFHAIISGMGVVSFMWINVRVEC